MYQQTKKSAFSQHSMYIGISIVFSLLFHLILIEGTGSISISVPGNFKEITKDVDADMPFVMEIVPDMTNRPSTIVDDADAFSDDISAQRGLYDGLDDSQFEINPVVEDIFIESDLYDPPTSDIRFAGVQKEAALIQAPAETPQPLAALPAVAPRPEIIEIPFKDLTAERQDLPSRAIKPALERHDVVDIDLPSLAMPGDFIATAQNEVKEIQIKAARPTFSAPDFEIADDGTIGLAEGAELETPEISAGGESNSFEAFDSFVGVNMRIKPDTLGNGGYFEIDIAPNSTSGVLRNIPKDLLFLIDCSTSISPQKFRQFQIAVVDALGHLKSTDRFNIVFFNDKNKKIFKTMAPATGQNIHRAEKVVFSQKVGGRTDVFNGLSPFVKDLPADSTRPLNIFLMTDGKSTVNIFKSSDFLKQISDLNKGNVSIFPFSAGKDANRQLLDYLGYLNRGGKHHVDDITQIRNQLSDFIVNHSNMLIQDMHFTTNAAFSKEIYPKSLPHLYKNDVLKLYGRYENEGDELVLTLTGRDADGKSRDFVLRRKLSECTVGDDSLPMEWAAQKILWLNAQKNSTNNADDIQSIEKQIDVLRREFKVYVPEK